MISSSSSSHSVLVFTVNGRRVEERNVDPEMTLLKYWRTKLHLTGSKLGCGEGGCGACTVVILNPFKTVNACLLPLAAVHNLHILTIEGLEDGLGRRVQERMTELHGSQCGFCTPGFVMSITAGLNEGVVDVEDALAGNLCRCTGYRPIIEAYNQLFNEPSEHITNPRSNLENLETSVVFKGPRVTWITVKSFNELLDLKEEYREMAVIVNGNTEVGIDLKFKNVIPQIMLYPQWIEELQQITIKDEKLVIGGAVTLQGLANFLKQNNEINRLFDVLKEGLKWFAGKQIRNVATLAGNIATASPISDLNPILTAFNSEILLTSNKGSRLVRMRDFILGYRKTVISKEEVIESICIPFLKEDEFAWTYKQSKRKEDDVAIVNCGIWCKRDLSEMCMALGGVDSYLRVFTFTKTASVDVIYQEITKEIKMKSDVPGGMPEYRLALIKGFLYKFFKAFNNEVEEREEKREFKVYSKVGSNTPHVSGDKHCSGKAQYVDDMPMQSNELYAYPILSTKAHAMIKIDTVRAKEAYPQAVFVNEDDLPLNCNIIGPIRKDEKVFYSRECTSVGQILMFVLAEDQFVAQRAAKLVHVDYKILPFILTIEDAIKAESYHAHRKLERSDSQKSKVGKEIDGSVKIHGQEHFYLETQGAIIIPKEDEYYEIYASTQNPTEAQHFVSHVLGIPQAQVQCNVKRLGGGFGGKETRSSFLVAALAVAAQKTKRPVRCMLDREQDMLFSGHRHSFLANYKIRFDQESGKLFSLEVNLYSNGGHSLDLSLGVMERAMAHVDNGYYVQGGVIRGHVCKTNTPSNTAFRGFGAPQGMFVMETIMSHIAHEVKLPREQVQRVNLLSSGQMALIGQPSNDCTLREMWDRLYEEKSLPLSQQVEEFNSNHKDQVQTVAMVPTKFGIAFGVRHLNQASALVHLQRDGSVMISHGGVEMGQGLHTKLVQIASQAFSIEPRIVKIKETSTATVANSSPTAASASSDLYGRALLDACAQLLERLRNVEGDTWKERINKAYLERIDLSAHGFYKTPPEGFDWETGKGELFSYFTYGVAVAHVQIDMHTGDHRVLGTHLLMDLGLPINAAIDIGQVEGGFLQGLGLFTREELLYSPRDGMLLTRGPGIYKIPSVHDVPRVFTTELYQSPTNSTGSAGVMGSKAVGEPPLFLAASVFFAIHKAIQTNTFIKLDSPATPETVKLALDKVELLPGPRWSTRI